MTVERVNDIVHSGPSDTDLTRTICIPINDDYSHVIHWAITNSLNPVTDKVVLLHVREVEHAALAYPYFPAHESMLEMEEKLKSSSITLLKNAADDLLKHNIQCRAVSLRGDPREELEFKINKLQPDFVIVANKNSRSLKKLLMGSVSNYLLHHLNYPIVVVPADN
ncbi:hypothetical protein BC833DRAFT_623655 [Globomyces pollinis-pini]|nr:hypothetical protein BC833DRAFT_623655 [Globomyces pollinis-pini]